MSRRRYVKLCGIDLTQPDDWDYTLAGLEYICKDGITSIRTTVVELEEHSYISRQRLRNEKGQLGYVKNLYSPTLKKS